MARERHLIRLLGFLLLAAVSCQSGGGGTNEPPPPVFSTRGVLRLADAEGQAGATATLSLSLENPAALAGLQFDLAADPGALTVIAAAGSARSAGLEASFFAGGGTTRVLLADLQGTALIAAGDGVVATLTVQIAQAASGPIDLLVRNASGVDASATTLSIGGSAAVFTVR